MIPTRFGMLGFATPIYSKGSLKREPVYSTNESVVLPLNLRGNTQAKHLRPYLYLFSNPRLIIKLTFFYKYAAPTGLRNGRNAYPHRYKIIAYLTVKNQGKSNL